jgi:hypothetical protein
MHLMVIGVRTDHKPPIIYEYPKLYNNFFFIQYLSQISEKSVNIWRFDVHNILGVLGLFNKITMPAIAMYQNAWFFMGFAGSPLIKRFAESCFYGSEQILALYSD